MRHRVVDELHGIVALMGAIWVVFIMDAVVPGTFNVWGLIPRTVGGLPGIVTMPFLHGSWNHLLSNTVPLAVLLSMLAGSRADSQKIVLHLILLGGALLWLLGKSSHDIHVGASGLIYSLTTFLIVAGFTERRLLSLIVAIVVGATYGLTLLSGVLPTVGPGVSWDGHLWGAVAGVIVARRAIRT